MRVIEIILLSIFLVILFQWSKGPSIDLDNYVNYNKVCAIMMTAHSGVNSRETAMVSSQVVWTLMVDSVSSGILDNISLWWPFVLKNEWGTAFLT